MSRTNDNTTLCICSKRKEVITEKHTNIRKIDGFMPIIQNRKQFYIF